FILVGIGLAGAGRREPNGRRVAAACGLVVLLIGALTLLEFIVGADFGIDELAVRDTGTLRGSGFPGRMSPITATAWMALGPAIVLLAAGRGRTAITAGHVLVVYAGFVAFLAAAGYTFGAEQFWGIGIYTAVAIHTALGLLLAATAALVTRPDEGWLAGLADSPGARSLLIQLLPISLLLPSTLGFLLLFGAGLGAYNAAFGFALLVPCTALALVAVALRVARGARTSELALRASEQRYRRIFEQVNDLIFTADLDQIITDCNPATAAAMEMERDELIGRRIAEFVSREGFEQTSRMLRHKLEQGGTTRHDIEVRTKSGKKLFWEINSGLSADSKGRIIGLNAIARDVTDRRALEERQRLLINELNHRVKNTLAIVQSVARQTLKPDGDPAGMRAALEGRLAALSAAHDLLTREQWSPVDLAEIVRDSLKMCTADDSRFRIDGPPVRLSPRSAVSFAMAMHELCTNALKYGALSSPEGRVAVYWDTGNGEAARLRLVWEEKGGPAAAKPVRRGFGSRMIEQALAYELGGRIALDFRAEGLVCTIDAPLPEET
ncbi:MAG TPA: HWE histidine kinase domain-containing protein, partial [Allosphingosinicella sp.]|nr:HWE histidine kinase domain-containing protein [Allosphingosinicella sp.]